MSDGTGDLILDLLDDERAAILAGAFDRLGRIAADKETLFTRLAQDGPPAGPGIARIAARVERDQRLLAAAIAGLRDAGARLRVLRAVRDGFSSYDARGVRATVAQTPPSFGRKA